MNPRKIKDHVHWLGAIDWDRRLFDALIPLPEGTSYNAYLVEGSDKIALLDTVDPSVAGILLDQLAAVPRLDYLVCHHVEQDHAGTIPAVLAKYPGAVVVCSPKAREMLGDHLGIPADRVMTVEDGQTLALGGKTLTFIHAPWVHWPETMLTYAREDRILFSCDLFGAHLATPDLFAAETEVYHAAKRYFAEIMMPFRSLIPKHLARLDGLEVEIIAPSHGPLHRRPPYILEAYREWAAGAPLNQAVIPYVSMHGSTARMIEHLAGALIARGVAARQFDLTVADLGLLAMALVDAATIVIGTPTVLVGPHPAAAHAATLANALRPKARFASVVCSYGWGSKAVEEIAGRLPNLKVEMLPPVLCKGVPKDEDFQALDVLAESVAAKHRELAGAV